MRAIWGKGGLGVRAWDRPADFLLGEVQVSVRVRERKIGRGGAIPHRENYCSVTAVTVMEGQRGNNNLRRSYKESLKYVPVGH